MHNCVHLYREVELGLEQDREALQGTQMGEAFA
jgi:hypothetical protein